MLETSARLLRLLSLLQARRDWTSAELAARLGVTTRTIRNDVDRLRGLGYPVDARPGVAGGYRLGTGGTLPPLLLDDDEAVAVAIGLRTAASGSIAGIEETSLRALAKLQQMLPLRLRRRVSALGSTTLPVPSRGPQMDPDVLTMIAVACRDHERLRFDYRAHSGAPSRRSVEPYRLVNDRRRWYLVAWDTDRDAWRTFRADRIEPRAPAGPRFTPRALPPDREIAAQVARGVGEATWRYRAQVIVHAPAAHVRGRLPIPVEVEPMGEDRCAFEPGSDDPETLALYLGMLDADFEIVDAPELVNALRKLTGRYQRAIDASTRPRRPDMARRRAAKTVDELLAEARAVLPDRPSPTEALQAQASGALLVDIREDDQRRADGLIPGAIALPRNSLEWRCDPASQWRHPAITRWDLRIILICNQGYQSSLAAANLQQLGLTHATDLDGGFTAWAAAGLPVVRCRSR
jgi:predicted DNA-binding transcriptional regulator YafY/rhodanese-related sulfurtransferase